MSFKLNEWTPHKRQAFRDLLEGLVGVEMQIQILCDNIYTGRIEEFTSEKTVKVTLLRDLDGNIPQIPVRWMPYHSAIFRHPAIHTFYRLYV